MNINLNGYSANERERIRVKQYFDSHKEELLRETVEDTASWGLINTVIENCKNELYSIIEEETGCIITRVDKAYMDKDINKRIDQMIQSSIVGRV